MSVSPFASVFKNRVQLKRVQGFKGPRIQVKRRNVQRSFKRRSQEPGARSQKEKPADPFFTQSSALIPNPSLTAYELTSLTAKAGPRIQVKSKDPKTQQTN